MKSAIIPAFEMLQVWLAPPQVLIEEGKARLEAERTGYGSRRRWHGLSYWRGRRISSLFLTRS